MECSIERFNHVSILVTEVKDVPVPFPDHAICHFLLGQVLVQKPVRRMSVCVIDSIEFISPSALCLFGLVLLKGGSKK